MSYIVVRTHSNTDRQTLWKVISRPFTRITDATQWKEFEESQEKNKKHKFFIVTIVE
jgi:hypothetical protein